MKKIYQLSAYSICFGIVFFLSQENVLAANLKGCSITDIPEALPTFISNLINLFKILVPILLIIMGMFDFVRAVMSSDEKQMKEAQSRFIRRILAAVLIFFVVAIVQFVFNAIGHDNENIVGCIDCFVNGNCQTTEQKIKTCKINAEVECDTSCFKKTGTYNTEYTTCMGTCTQEKYQVCE